MLAWLECLLLAGFQQRYLIYHTLRARLGGAYQIRAIEGSEDRLRNIRGKG